MTGRCWQTDAGQAPAALVAAALAGCAEQADPATQAEKRAVSEDRATFAAAARGGPRRAAAPCVREGERALRWTIHQLRRTAASAAIIDWAIARKCKARFERAARIPFDGEVG